VEDREKGPSRRCWEQPRQEGIIAKNRFLAGEKLSDSASPRETFATLILHTELSLMDVDEPPQ